MQVEVDMISNRLLRLSLHFVVIAVFGFLQVGCAEEKDAFLVALAEIPRSNTDRTSSVTQVVENKFPPGSDLQSALHFLEERGFKVFPSTAKNIPPSETRYVAERHKAYKLIHTETIRIIIESDGKKVLKARGQFFLS
jgi:hypothetical protein